MENAGTTLLIAKDKKKARQQTLGCSTFLVRPRQQTKQKKKPAKINDSELLGMGVVDFGLEQRMGLGTSPKVCFYMCASLYVYVCVCVCEDICRQL